MKWMNSTGSKSDCMLLEVTVSNQDLFSSPQNVALETRMPGKFIDESSQDLPNN